MATASCGAGETHLDPVAADRDAGGQAGEPALEGVGWDRDADPGAAGLAEHGPHLVAAGGFVPEGGGPFGAAGAGGGALGWARVRIEPVRSAPTARIRVAARARETPKSASRSRRVSKRPVERVELLDGVGEGEEPPRASWHLTLERLTCCLGLSWAHATMSYLMPC